MEHSGGIQSSLGGRYATALFDLACEAKPGRSDAAGDAGGTLDAVAASLENLRRALADLPDFRALTASPLVGRADARRAVAGLTDALGLDPITAKFLGVLAENRRLAQLPQILRAFRTLLANHRGETTAEVTSAHPLDTGQQDALKQQLKTRLGRDVSIDLSVDPALLGGLVVRIGSQMIDSSIRTRLNTLSQAMKG